jgi:hypothetical protein
MKKVFPLATLFMGLSIPIVSSPAIAVKSQCQRAVNTAKKQLGNVQSTRNILLDSNYGKYPPDRPRGLVFTLKTEKSMTDTKLQTNISTNIISKCSNFSLVTFSVDQTDWVNTYGLVHGRIKAFTCKEAGDRTAWGEQICF